MIFFLYFFLFYLFVVIRESIPFEIMKTQLDESHTVTGHSILGRFNPKLQPQTFQP